ncbi:MAG: rhodanese-like domain-containing protein, partial [Aggregatilineales bacterium]
EFLAAMGYKSLVNINGGTLGWAQRGNPLEK